MEFIEKLILLLNQKDFSRFFLFIAFPISLFFPSLLYILIFNFEIFEVFDIFKILAISITSNIVIILISSVFALDYVRCSYIVLKEKSGMQMELLEIKSKFTSDLLNKISENNLEEMSASQVENYYQILLELKTMRDEIKIELEGVQNEYLETREQAIVRFLISIISILISLTFALILLWILGFDFILSSRSVLSFILITYIIHNLMIIIKSKRIEIKKVKKSLMIRKFTSLAIFCIIIAMIIFSLITR